MSPLIAPEFVVAVSIPVGAVGRRMAGGVLSQWLGVTVPDQVVRLLWGACLGLIAFLAGLVWWQALAIIPLLWAGSTGGMWGAFTMGRRDDRSVWLDAALMFVYGAGCVAPIAAGALWLGYGWKVLLLLWAAIACPIFYELAWLFPAQMPWLGCYSNDPPPTAELAWGASVGASIAFLVLLGV